MCKNTKKLIERNAKTLFKPGTTCRVTQRGNPIEDEAIGEATILEITREEITTLVQGRQFGFEGRTLKFRLPALTQKGGNLALCLP